MQGFAKRLFASFVVTLSVPSIALANTTYTVKSGDTLWHIAEQYHVSVSAIQQANHIGNGILHLGEKIVIPDGKTSSSSKATHSTSTSNSSSPRYITVHSGDTLWGISSHYGVSVANLEKWNHLTSKSTLKLGERLLVGYSTSTSSSGLSGRSGSVLPSLATAAYGLQVAQFGEKFIGTPYRWGGDSPSGFDCSGFVYYTYGHFGVHLNRTSYGMFQQGTAVSRGDLLPGDLVFFDSDGGGASHVGIYVGGGKFINAAGPGVRYDSLNDGYWSSHYVGARRVHS